MAAGVSVTNTAKRPFRGMLLAAALIAGSAAMLLFAELVASQGLPRISRIEKRTSDEIAAALEFHRAAAGPRKALVLGNSLLLEGVDFPSLARSLEGQIEVRRVVVEQTFYLDWYYGMRRLFAHGSDPDVVVLELSALQLLSGNIRGDYSARRLFDLGDLLSVARDAGYSPTQGASLWAAHWSGFFGTRAEIRKWLLGKFMPAFPELQPHLVRNRPIVLTREEILSRAPARLQALQRLAEEHGARFILLAPATLGEGSETEALLESGRIASVDVLAPLARNEAPANEFSDGFHLNSAGARRYTAALVPLLRNAIGPPSSASAK